MKIEIMYLYLTIFASVSRCLSLFYMTLIVKISTQSFFLNRGNCCALLCWNWTDRHSAAGADDV